MGKTLYLNENKDVSVTRDGPSLWVVQKGKAGIRVPARRVDRVVISGNVRFDSGMLTLFTERGVPITFLNPQGEPTATAMGIRAPDWALRERQYLLGTTPEGRLHGENWLRAKKRERRLSLLRKFAPASAKKIERKGLTESEYEKALRAILPYEPKARDTLRELITGLFFETVLKIVYDTGLDPHCGIVSRREDFGLVKDLCGVIEPEISRQVKQFFMSHLKQAVFRDGKKIKALLYKKGGTWKISREGRREVISRFENNRERLITLIEALVEDMVRMIRESLYEDKISCVL